MVGMRFRYFALGCVVALLLTPSSNALAQDDSAVINRIVAHWREQRRQVRSVRYVMTGETLIPRGRFTGVMSLPAEFHKKVVPAKDYRYTVGLKWVIDFENHRFRKEYRGQVFYADKAVFTPKEWIHVFDGSTTKCFFPLEANKNSKGSEDADLGIVHKSNNVETDSCDDPAFFPGGVIPSVRHAINDPGNIPLLEARTLQLINRAPLGNVECLILKVKPPPSRSGLHNEIWVEQEGKQRILRKDLWAGKELLERVDVEYKGELPAKWVATSFFEGKLFQIEWITVEEVETNPSLEPAVFDIQLEAGLRVRKDEKEYLVAEDGKTLIEWEKRAQKPSRPSLLLWVGILLVGGVVLVVWICRRWKPRRSTAAPDNRNRPPV